MDRLAKQQACQLFIEQEIEKGLVGLVSTKQKIDWLKEKTGHDLSIILSSILEEETSSERAMAIICFCPPQKKIETIGNIYFARSKDLIKIGFAENVKERISTLKTISSIPPKLIFSIKGTAKEEREIHKKFNHLRHHGEWFRFGEEIKNYIDAERNPQNG
jgi:hypothetical protein